MLIATSVAARGLDVKDLKLVINYDVPSHLEDYVHRVGRTGRAGRKGTAFTFVTPEQDNHTPDMVKALEQSGAPIPDDLKKLAEGFNKKKEEGQLVAVPSSGYGGRGFKFDEAEEQKKKEELKLQKKAMGIDDGSDEEGGDDDSLDDESESKLYKEAQAAAQAVIAAGGDASMLTPFLKAGKEELPAGVTLVEPVSKQAVAQVLGATAAAAAAVAKAPPNLAEAQRKAKELAQQLAIKQAAKMLDTGPKNHFEAEVEVNDYPQQVRWKVTHKEQIQQIVEWTGAGITTKGTFIQPGRQPGPGERKLYLLIEATTEAAVKRAKSELKRLIEEALVSAAQSAQSFAQPTGRYSVV
jgi:ATP-dependent RNA helicase DDX46/PRP5